jgi:hypothetical protein
MGGNYGRKNRQSAKERKLKEVAYHEAGHAVAAVVYGQSFRYLTIRPDKEEGTLGHVTYPGLSKGLRESLEFRKPTDKQRMDMERHVITSFAGGQAQARLRGRHDHVGARGDYESAATFAVRIVGSGKPLDTFLTYAVACAEHCVKNNWKHICKVAAAVLAHPRHRLSQREVKELMYGPKATLSKTGKWTIPPLPRDS